MAGLCAVAGGLNEGTGLQFQTQIGTTGFTDQIGAVVIPDVLTSDASFVLSSDGDNIVTAR